jgi:hypothetical protein
LLFKKNIFVTAEKDTFDSFSRKRLIWRKRTEMKKHDKSVFIIDVLASAQTD